MKLKYLFNKQLLQLGALLLMVFITIPAYAGKDPKGSATDARVKTFNFSENEVYALRGHYGFSTVIEFSSKERIESISIGDSIAWQVVKPNLPNILFIKPLEKDAKTNMSVITTKRIYTFALSAKKAANERSEDLTFRLKFNYPEDAAEQLVFIGDISASGYNPLEKVSAADLNFDYSYSGSKRLRPIRAFDDGKLTYFQFNEFETLPAVFSVDDNKNERLVNFNMQGQYLVVSGINARFIFRDGDTITRIFNEAYPKNDDIVTKPQLVGPIEKNEDELLDAVPMPGIKPHSNSLLSSLASLFTNSDTNSNYKPANSFTLNN